MKNKMLKYKKINNFGLITVNGEHIFFSIKKFGFFFCKLQPSQDEITLLGAAKIVTRWEGGGVEISLSPFPRLLLAVF